MRNSINEKDILRAAKTEFLEKGYINASMRNIAEKAGCTTGMLYSRFKDKDKIFSELVEKGATELFEYFCNTHKNFKEKSPQIQIDNIINSPGNMDKEMIEIMYKHFDSFKLLINCSTGSSYEYYFEKLIDIEVNSTIEFIKNLQENGFKVRVIRKDMCHMLATSLLNGISEVIAHDFSKEDALEYTHDLMSFFSAGWREILQIRK